MDYQPKILIFAGSLRKASFNKKLALCAVKQAEDVGAAVTYVDLSDYTMPIFNEDDEAASGAPESAQAFKQLVQEHDGIVIACPEYNGSVTAVLKNTIDWTSRGENVWADKAVSLLSASPGGLGGMRGLVHVRQILTNLEALVLPGQKAISSAHQAFDEAGELLEERAKDALKGQMEKLTELLITLKG